MQATTVRMPLSRSSVARSDLRRAAKLFHALSDDTRLAIVARLRRGERCVCELTDSLEAAQSRLSFHLKVLKDAGIVLDRRDGRWVHYRVDEGALEAAAHVLAALRPQQRAQAVQCCD